MRARRRTATARTGRGRPSRRPATALRIDVPARTLPVPAARLRTLVARAVAATGFPGRLSVAVVGDAAMRVVNRDFHGCDEPTDVLAFALDRPPGPAGRAAFDGEVIVSLDTARREAGERGVGLADELVLYVVHGALHLTGEDDHDAASYRRMHARALSILEGLGLENTIDPPEAKLAPRRGKKSPR